MQFNKLGLTIGDKKVLSGKFSKKNYIFYQKIDKINYFFVGVTGTIHHKRVTAVMGPSGAGKTTFLT